MRDLRLLPRLQCVIPSLDCNVMWFDTDVSGLPIGPMFKDQAWSLNMGLINSHETSRYQTTCLTTQKTKKLMVINFRVASFSEHFLDSWATVNFRRRLAPGAVTLLHPSVTLLYVLYHTRIRIIICISPYCMAAVLQNVPEFSCSQVQLRMHTTVSIFIVKLNIIFSKQSLILLINIVIFIGSIFRRIPKHRQAFNIKYVNVNTEVSLWPMVIIC
jgi:hypothetical protein